MDLTVYRPDFLAIGIIDNFKSLIWTERYSECGDFELCCPADSVYLSLLSIGNYLTLTGSNQTMVIEGIEIKTDVDDGNLFYITGRSLESMLDRRIIWNQTILKADDPDPEHGSYSVANNIRLLVQQNIANGNLNPIAVRKIENFVTGNPPTEIKLKFLDDMVFHGENLYDVVKALCELYGLGFKIEFDTTYVRYIFRVYEGKDRSYGQNKNSIVIFSTDFDNLLGSDYHQSIQDFKNLAYIGGEEREGEKRRFVQVKPGGSSSELPKGLDRREIFVDARSVTSNIDILDANGEPVSISTYNNRSTYAVGEYCRYDLQVYQSNKAITGSSSKDFTPSEWNTISAADYDSTTTYQKDQYCWYNDGLYRAKQAINTAEEWTSSHWSKIELTIYKGSKSYSQGAYCILDEPVYRCKTAIATAEEWNVSHWEFVKTRLNDNEYAALLRQQGALTLDENTVYATFEGQMSETSQYVYDQDFSLGDIVQIANEYGLTARARITEMIHSHDENGEVLYPTFSLI